MMRGCLGIFGVGLLAIAMLIVVFAKDPLESLWRLADLNGGVSRWEERTVRIVSVERDCRPLELDGKEQSPWPARDICSQPRLLQAELAHLVRKRSYGQPCYETDSGKTCPGVWPTRFSGSATITVEGVNQRDAQPKTSFDVSNSQELFYVAQRGDELAISVCRSDPTIIRLSARFQTVPGCD